MFLFHQEMNGLSPVGKLINVNKTKSLVSGVIDIIIYYTGSLYIGEADRIYIVIIL